MFDSARFLQISTDEVYGSLPLESDEKFTEESPLRPNSPYSASKAGADLLCRAYFITYGMPILITRSSNNFGPRQYPEKLIPLTIKRALEGKPIPVYGDGQNVRDWLYVEDNCEAIDLVLHKGKVGEIYNIGGGNEWKNIDLVNLICEILSELIGKPIEEYKKLITFVKDRPGHDRRYALSIEKIERELGWRPRKDFRESLRETEVFYLKNGKSKRAI
jgi:dTDP-glucose 4,6-dehydratase